MFAQTILMMEEVDKSLFSGKPTDDHIALEVCDGQFAWDSVGGTEGQNSSDRSKRHQTKNHGLTPNNGHQESGIRYKLMRNGRTNTLSLCCKYRDVSVTLQARSFISRLYIGGFQIVFNR
jgi:hypothetical protein